SVMPKLDIAAALPKFDMVARLPKMPDYTSAIATALSLDRKYSTLISSSGIGRILEQQNEELRVATAAIANPGVGSILRGEQFDALFRTPAFTAVLERQPAQMASVLAPVRSLEILERTEA